MPKPKKRIGLQKDFSTIFDGVWIPPKPSKEKAQADQTEQDQDNALRTPTQNEQEQAPDVPASDQQAPAADTPTFNDPDQVVETQIAGDQRYAVETHVSDEQNQADDTATFEGHRREIEEIISSMKCSKDFACYKSSFKNLCKVRNIGEGKIIECSPENQGPCVYRFTFVGKIFCKCPLRYYIARNLNM